MVLHRRLKVCGGGAHRCHRVLHRRFVEARSLLRRRQIGPRNAQLAQCRQGARTICEAGCCEIPSPPRAKTVLLSGPVKLRAERPRSDRDAGSPLRAPAKNSHRQPVSVSYLVKQTHYLQDQDQQHKAKDTRKDCDQNDGALLSAHGFLPESAPIHQYERLSQKFA